MKVECQRDDPFTELRRRSLTPVTRVRFPYALPTPSLHSVIAERVRDLGRGPDGYAVLTLLADPGGSGWPWTVLVLALASPFV